MSDRDGNFGGWDFDRTLDNEETYDEKVRPIMQQLIHACNEAKIPFIAILQIKDNGFATYALLAPGCDYDLAEAISVVDPSWVAGIKKSRVPPSSGNLPS